MRWPLLFVLVSLTGCGYVGDPLPPALHIPRPVPDLAVRQVGSELLVSFTIPGTTTEDLPVAKAVIDLRIGESISPVQMESWANATAPILFEGRPPGPVEFRFPVDKWAGRDAVFGVRLQNPRGRYSAWSAPVGLRVLPAIAPPTGLRAEAHPEGVRLFWRPQPDVQWRIYKLTPDGKEFVETGIATAPEFIDKAAPFGKPQSYKVQARRDTAVSDLSAPVAITPEDRFPPAAPRGLTAIAGVSVVEMSWDRNLEADLKGYRVHRSEAGTAFKVVSDSITTPAYTDRAIESGKQYRYRITAVDQNDNESLPSDAVEITAP